MPSAEPKQETMASSDAADPFQKAVTYLKFKIKNMDQRKKNLENIQEKITAGLEKELEAAQVTAAAKLPEVSSNIVFLEQTLSRLLTHREEAAKLERARKQQAKLERVQHDLERLRRILLIQDVLVNIDDRVRAALLAGAEGVPQLTETELQQIDNIYKMVTPNREEEEESPIKEQISSAAEHLLRLADRSQKKIAGTTYENLSKTLEAVFDSGVFSAAALLPEQQEEEEEEEEPVLENGLDAEAPETAAEELPAPAEPEQMAAAEQPEVEPAEVALEPQPPVLAAAAPVEAPLLGSGAAPGSAGDGPPYPQEVLVHAPPLPVPVPVPVPVVPQLPHQPPISFLQESELLRADPAVIDPAVVGFQPAATPDYHQISSQTFTNTNFAGLPAPTVSLSDYVSAGGVYAAAGAVVDTTPNPPPPIPLPRQEPPAPEPPQPQQAAPPQPQTAPVPAPPPSVSPVAAPVPAENAWTSRQAPAVVPEPTPPAPVPVPTPAATNTSSWGERDGDTEIGQWDSGAGQTSWENGNSKQADSWAENGDTHWAGNDGRRGGYRSRGGPRSRGQTNGGGYSGRGRGGYDRPPRSGGRGGYDDRRGGYDDRQDRRGGYDDRRGGERPEQRRGGGADRPYRGARGGGRGAPRGRAPPARQQ